jgi:hypothetical protein
MSRGADLDRLYEALHRLEEYVGGRRLLSQCNGRLPWPKIGVYFVFESSEPRSVGDGTTRVVRVGTHALTRGSGTTLWQRLSQHRGTRSPMGGNHRGSIFRLLVGEALQVRDPGLTCRTWGSGRAAQRSVRENERRVEIAVSEHIGGMTGLWLAIEDAPGPGSMRGYVERNTIALLSNFDRSPIDPPSPDWLGRLCPRERVQRSGLWNSNHVDEGYEPAFLDTFERLVKDLDHDPDHQ